MHNPELVHLVELEASPAEGVRITLEDSLLERVKEVAFSIPEFHSWAQSRGLADPENHPLEINIKERCYKDTDDERKTNGTFYIDLKSGTANIDLFLGRRIGVFDLFSDEHDTEYREQVFNDAVNRTFAHEIEHYIEASNGQNPQVIAAESKVQEFIQFVKPLIDAAIKADAQVTDETLRTLVYEHTQEETYESYLEQPHEIRAREAGDLYGKERGNMIWISLSPPPKESSYA